MGAAGKALAVALAFIGSPNAAGAQGETVPLTILTEAGARAFAVEIADEPRERAQGLMHRESMAPAHGMLFDFGESRPVSMWMKNTLIPLDMLFIDEDGIIVNIIARTEPHSLESRPSDGPVRYTLELLGGVADLAGIRAGDQVCSALWAEAVAACADTQG